MRTLVSNTFLVIIMLVIQSSFARLQSAPDELTLSISGHPGYIKVAQANGRSYVEIEDLTRLTQGTLTFKGNQMILRLPPESGDASAPAAQRSSGFSREFLGAGIEFMGAIREWRITVVTAIQNNSPAPEEWVSELRRKADKNLAFAAAARSTSDDRNGYPLLAGEFANMQTLSDRFLSKRKALQYVDPKSIDNDPLDQQILSCARSLASMAADNQLRDEPACNDAH